ncbi:hypothetical protein LCM28_05570 [Salipiger pacificus]|nr:hypothetical protein [Alloyangia pacifica]
MYIAFLDESDHTTKNKFTVCGMTVFPVDKLEQLSSEISALRDSAKFGPCDALKFASSSRPDSCSEKTHLELKRSCIDLANHVGAVFFAYAYFNGDDEANNPDRNRIFGFNTLLHRYDAFLSKKESVGIALCDRLEIEKNKKNKKKVVLKYRDGFEYLREKFQLGNDFPDGKRKNLSRILAFGQTADGLSHASSVNDILTGGMRYVANGDKESARKDIQEDIERVMCRGDDGKFKDTGFLLRPLSRKNLPEDTLAEYDALRAFLNNASAKSA